MTAIDRHSTVHNWPWVIAYGSILGRMNPPILMFTRQPDQEHEPKSHAGDASEMPIMAGFPY